MVKQERKRGEGICAYCGRTRRITADHIPPRNLFIRPRLRLITVPCCDECNKGTSKDDEYLRIALALRHEARQHPSLVALLPEIQRRLQRAEGEAFARTIASRTSREWVSTPQGIAIPAT